MRIHGRDAIAGGVKIMKTIISECKIMKFPVFAAFLVVLLAAGTALAGVPFGNMGGGEFEMHGLDLSGKQESEIHEIFEHLRKDSREAMAGLRTGIKDLKPVPSEKEREDVEKVIAEMVFKTAEAHHDAFLVLTPEQRLKLADEMGNRAGVIKGGRKDLGKDLKERLTSELDLTADQQKKLAAMELRGHGPADGMPFMAEGLDLSAEQETKIRDILEKHRCDNEEHRRSMEKMKKLRDLSVSSSFEEEAAMTLSSQIARDMVTGILERKTVDAEIEEVLTEEQKRKFRKFEDRPLGRGPLFGGPSPMPDDGHGGM